tara:strand:- start:101 stop:517 length:417 start_codon:yes stop_codon:yes gene_type:complete
MYYQHCNECKVAVDQCAEEIEVRISLGDADIVSGRVLIALDDNEAPDMLAYDRGLFCGEGGRKCDCDCSIGFPDMDKSLYDVFCCVHGGTEAEQQVASEELCKQGGHLFPLDEVGGYREGECGECGKAYFIPAGNILV